MGVTRPETLVQEALAPEKMAEAQHAAMGTRTHSPCLPRALPSARPPDAYLQNPARARQKRPISQGRPPRTPATRACLTITLALTCLNLAHLCKACPLPCAPPPARHQPALQGINHTSNSPPLSSLHHRRPNIESLIKDAERAAASSNSNSEQQQQQRAAATTANNSSEQQQRAAAASSSSEQQQRAATASSSTSEQHQRAAATASEQQRQGAAAAAASRSSDRTSSSEPYTSTTVQNTPYHTSYTAYQVNKPQTPIHPTTSSKYQISKPQSHPNNPNHSI